MRKVVERRSEEGGGMTNCGRLWNDEVRKVVEQRSEEGGGTTN